MMRILLAEDDSRLGKLIEYMLAQNKFNVEWITNGADIFEYAMYSEYDILILDWMMPNVSGLEACRQLREAGYERAIIMLTAKDTVEDRVMGLDAGADDYLVKPFEFEELLARLRALGRRSTQKIQQEVIEIGIMLMRFMTVIVLCQVSQVIFLGSLRGAGDVRFTAIACTISIAIVRPSISYLAAYTLGWGIAGIWIGILFDQFARLTLTGLRFRSGKWMHKEI